MLYDFGFCGYKHLYMSLLRLDNAKILVVFALMGSVVGSWLGLSSQSILVLFILLICELMLGIGAAFTRKDRFRVGKLQKFGLKVLVYFLLLLVLYTFKLQYTGRPEEYVYAALHSFAVFYIIGVYLISALENTSYILGGSKEINVLLRIMKIKFRDYGKLEDLDYKDYKKKNEIIDEQL